MIGERLIQIRPAASIYHAEGGWFSANWHFSFDEYHDPDNMGWGTLRVFNDDRLAPGAVWPMHPHRDIEGITYVAEGTFEHADSLGKDGVLSPGSVQRMTLGSGAWHSERNHSKVEPMRFIQFWIIPAQFGLEPGVEQRSFSEADRLNRLRPVLVPSPGFGGHDAPSASDAVSVHQDAALYAGLLEPGVRAERRLRPGFGAYFFVVRGEATLHVGGQGVGTVDACGAAKLAGVDGLEAVAGPRGAEVLLVEVSGATPRGR